MTLDCLETHSDKWRRFARPPTRGATALEGTFEVRILSPQPFRARLILEYKESALGANGRRDRPCHSAQLADKCPRHYVPCVQPPPSQVRLRHERVAVGRDLMLDTCTRNHLELW